MKEIKESVMVMAKAIAERLQLVNVCCTCASFETFQGLLDKNRIVRICNRHGIVAKPNNTCEDHKAKAS